MAASAYRVISKKVENQIFRHNWIFTHACVYKQSTLTKQWNCNIFVQIWYSYFRYTGRLFLGCALFVAVTLSQLYEKRRRNKDWATEESLQKNRRFCVRDITFWLHALLSMSFFVALIVSYLSKWRTYWIVTTKIHITIGGNLCYAENRKISYNLILSLRTCFW